MKTQKLINSLDIINIYGNLPEEIACIADNSKKVKKDCVFFCRKGNNDSGANYLAEAVSRGATCVVTEEYIPCGACVIVVKNALDALWTACDLIFDYPHKKLRCFGVVGTNGKTTVCHILDAIFKKAGHKTCLVGTIGNYICGKRYENDLTTPGTIEMYELMERAVGLGADIFITEISAHAIYQMRTARIVFEGLIFTNCTEDHLDYFSSFGIYAKVKKSIFLENRCKFAVVNTDDATGKEIYSERKGKTFTYGIENPADAFARDIKLSRNGITLTLNLFDFVADISCGLYGEFNAYNILAASSCAAAAGVSAKDIDGALTSLTPVEGRMQLISSPFGALIFVDYAHTPDGLEKTLSCAKKICCGKLLCVFGCGGNREREKRAKMGKIAGNYADFTFITDDNPRDEDPEEIRKEIISGIKTTRGKFTEVGDRADAIMRAASELSSGDILIVAGKGAETYQEKTGVKYPFSDKDEIIDAVNKISRER